MKTLVAMTLSSLSLVACAHGNSAPTAAPVLEGRWTSAAPEPLPSANGSASYLVREFSFEADHWTIDFTVYADAQRSRPILSGRNSGAFRLGPAHDGIRDAEFDMEQRTLTPRNAAIAEALTAAGCGSGSWTVGVAQSVAENGCKAFRVFSREACEREYDVVRVESERLFLGARPADGFMCSPDRRPASTGTAALIRAR
jgi:hypothetical protein